MAACTRCRGGSNHLQVNSRIAHMTAAWSPLVAAGGQRGTASHLLKAYKGHATLA